MRLQAGVALHCFCISSCMSSLADLTTSKLIGSRVVQVNRVLGPFLQLRTLGATNES